jgi:hypothetical protein
MEINSRTTFGKAKYIARGAYRFLEGSTPLGFFIDWKNDARRYGYTSPESVMGFSIAALATTVGAIYVAQVLSIRDKVPQHIGLQGDCDVSRIDRTNGKVVVSLPRGFQYNAG